MVKCFVILSHECDISDRTLDEPDLLVVSSFAHSVLLLVMSLSLFFPPVLSLTFHDKVFIGSKLQTSLVKWKNKYEYIYLQCYMVQFVF